MYRKSDVGRLSKATLCCTDISEQDTNRRPDLQGQKHFEEIGGALDGAVGEGVARGALHAEEGDDVPRAGALDVLQLVAVHAHQPRHLRHGDYGLTPGSRVSETLMARKMGLGHVNVLVSQGQAGAGLGTGSQGLGFRVCRMAGLGRIQRGSTKALSAK